VGGFFVLVPKNPCILAGFAPIASTGELFAVEHAAAARASLGSAFSVDSGRRRGQRRWARAMPAPIDPHTPAENPKVAEIQRRVPPIRFIP
jgi:hypothetical protein